MSLADSFGPFGEPLTDDGVFGIADLANLTETDLLFGDGPSRPTGDSTSSDTHASHPTFNFHGIHMAELANQSLAEQELTIFAMFPKKVWRSSRNDFDQGRRLDGLSKSMKKIAKKIRRRELGAVYAESQRQRRLAERNQDKAENITLKFQVAELQAELALLRCQVQCNCTP